MITGGAEGAPTPQTLSATTESELLDALAQAQPGDTVEITAGTYLFPDGLSVVRGGTTDYPITIRPAPGAHVVLDGGVHCWSFPYTRWVDLELALSDPVRENLDNRPSNIKTYAATEVINCTIHDGGNCLDTNRTAGGSLFYGNLIFNGGYYRIWPDDTPEVPHQRWDGYAAYVQNDGPEPLRLEHNIAGYFADVQAWVMYGGAPANNMEFVGNVALQGVVLSSSGTPLAGAVVTDNFFYRLSFYPGTYRQDNQDIEFSRNWVYGIEAACFYGTKFQTVQFFHNVLYAPLASVALLPDHTADENVYYGATTQFYDPTGGPRLTFAAWQARGFDAHGEYYPGEPPPSVTVQPNRFAAISRRKGNIILWNPEEDAAMEVDLSPLGLEDGVSYRLLQYLNPLEEGIDLVYNAGNPVAQVPMTGWTVALPVGLAEPFGPSTFPRFGCFVVEARG